MNTIQAQIERLRLFNNRLMVLAFLLRVARDPRFRV